MISIQNMLPVINSHALEGTSAKVMAQFGHNFNAGAAISCDFGIFQRFRNSI